jgi:hypothetical protein
LSQEEAIAIEVDYELTADVPDFALCVQVASTLGDVYLHAPDDFQRQRAPRRPGRYTGRCRLKPMSLTPGPYSLNVLGAVPGQTVCFSCKSLLGFSVQLTSPIMSRPECRGWPGAMGAAAYEWEQPPSAHGMPEPLTTAQDGR